MIFFYSIHFKILAKNQKKNKLIIPIYMYMDVQFDPVVSLFSVVDF